MLIRGNLGRNRLDIQSGCLNDEKHLTVSAAATRSPREMPRRWESVQEEELKEEREVEGSALLDGPGEVWHLVTRLSGVRNALYHCMDRGKV